MTRTVSNTLKVLCLVLLSSCGRPDTTVDHVPAEFAPAVALPTPLLFGEKSIEEALVERRSVRVFEDTSLTKAELGQLLWAAQGITDARGFRTAPSAGALYPLELYVAGAEGLYLYDPAAHRLLTIRTDDTRQALYEAALRQEPIRNAPAVFILAAVYGRTEQKYGADRSPRYVHLEAGHVAQNLLLEAVSLGLGAVPVGAFHDELVQDVLGLPEDHLPVYLIPVGHPEGSGG